MGRIYNITFSGVTVAAAQDLIQIKGAAGKCVRILSQWCAATNTTLPTGQNLQLRSRVLPATVTDGTGGSSPTPGLNDQGDTAASLTAKANSTTKATTSGTAIVVYEDGFHVSAGHEHSFTRPPTVMVSQAFVFELLSTPSGTLNLSGGVQVEEIG